MTLPPSGSTPGIPIPHHGTSRTSPTQGPSTRDLLLEVLTRLDRIEKHLKIPRAPECDQPGCSNVATVRLASGNPPVSRKWCPECAPSVRGVIDGLVR